MQRIERLLQMHFAALTAIGGLLLSSGEVGIILPAIAVVAAVVSYLVVDRFQIFALPTSLAYVGMGIVAAYCMIEFMFTRTTNQLMVVAQLLVLVEVVLLFQKKNVRVFEQIGVFCLLELIVAAVFNSALMFGLLLIPFALLGLRALVLLQAMITINALGEREQGGIKTSASDACQLRAVALFKLPHRQFANSGCRPPMNPALAITRLPVANPEKFTLVGPAAVPRSGQSLAAVFNDAGPSWFQFRQLWKDDQGGGGAGVFPGVD